VSGSPKLHRITAGPVAGSARVRIPIQAANRRRPRSATVTHPEADAGAGYRAVGCYAVLSIWLGNDHRKPSFGIMPALSSSLDIGENSLRYRVERVRHPCPATAASLHFRLRRFAIAAGRLPDRSCNQNRGSRRHRSSSPLSGRLSAPLTAPGKGGATNGSATAILQNKKASGSINPAPSEKELRYRVTSLEKARQS
jgi:hypothetical protein